LPQEETLFQMHSFDKKIQMLDAGTSIFLSTLPYGSAIGALKDELSLYGKVYGNPSQEDLPKGVYPCDFFLDYSTPWRRRYISCRLESDGEVCSYLGADSRITTEPTPGSVPLYRYAAVFNQGDGNTPLRITVIAVCVAVLCILAVLAVPKWGWILIVAGLLASGRILIAQSKKAHETVRTIIRSLDEKSVGAKKA